MPSPRKSSRSRSPARSGSKTSRSRSRSRGRSKSPSRKAKASPSPSRAKSSPSRTRSSPARERTTPTRQSTRIAEKVQQKEQEAKSSESTTTVTTITTRTKRGGDSVDGKDADSSGPGRLAALASIVTIFVFPLLLLYVTLGCTKDACSLTLNIKIPKTLAAYYDRDALLAYLGLAGLLFILNKLPFGRVVDGLPAKGAKRQKYKCCAFWNILFVLTLYGALVYRKHPLTTIWYDKLPQMAVIGCVLSFPMALFMHLRARNAPKNALSVHGNSGNTVVDFLFGRELNPELFGVSVKLWVIQFSLLLWLLGNLAAVSKACLANKSPSYDLLLVTALQTWYILDFGWFEETALGATDVQFYGCGYMFFHGCLAFVPFLYTLQVRYILHNPQGWSNLALAGFALLFFVGYLLYRGANNQKYLFRKNPNDPSLAHLESLPTATNKRLLVSGWWGLVRKPNYLGDLIISFAWTLPCGCASAFPYLYPALLTLLLVSRAIEDDAQCKKKYGSAWDRYTQRVKKRIVPYIF